MKIFVMLLFVSVAAIVLYRMLQPSPMNYQSKAPFEGGKFRNLQSIQLAGFEAIPSYIKRLLLDKKQLTNPDHQIPITRLSADDLAALDTQSTHIIRLGHSTILIKQQGEYWLIDPVFSERASPVQWFGPKRFHPVPIDIAALPALTGVVISHNHYDHLDAGSIKRLKDKAERFIIPLGMSQSLLDFGVAAEKLHELDWWQSIQIGTIKITATPAQHFSGRGLLDGNASLWASWVFENAHNRFFFSGDSGYFSGFKDIGDKFGSFDLAMVEVGAWDAQWKDVHMTPEEAVQAVVDLNSQYMLPVHNGTFNLAFHAWTAPFIRVQQAAQARQVAALFPLMGDVITLPLEDNSAPLAYLKQNFWWQQ